MNLFAALAYLDQHTNLEATAGRAEGLSLDRMARLVNALADPQNAYPVIHITGTNGKGSVARMASELLRAAGLSVGTYTSPHLQLINERIRDAYFDYDKSDLHTSDLAVLEIHAQLLNRNRDRTVVIEGHCDNFGLGTQMRGQSATLHELLEVLEYLGLLGISP